MTIKNPGTGRGSPCMRGNTPFLREGVFPWVRSIQISPIRAPIGRSGGYLGDEIAKTGAHCFRKTPDCPSIAGLRGSACSKKGPNRPNWRGDSSRDGLADVEMAERGYGVPVRNTSTKVTLMIRYPGPAYHFPSLSDVGTPGLPHGTTAAGAGSRTFGGRNRKKGGPLFSKNPGLPSDCRIEGVSVLQKGTKLAQLEGR